MALTLTSYLVPNQITYVKITPGTPNASGVLVFDSANMLDISEAVLKRFVSVEMTPMQELEQINNTDSFVKNNVVQAISFNATIRELIPSNVLSAIQQVCMGFSYVRVEVGYASEFAIGTTVVKAAVAGVWGEAGGIGVQAGQNVNSLTILPAGKTSANGTGFWVGLLAGTIPF
ncbi:hypothetical protein [Armatimonas rosea]|uniref:Spore maturation protein SpmA n=1 Tax=Armatimonas rosea TaxID=685828 RepID=A0A7W9SUW0_ARMRO|nr:hypothetical protein [Armatimonas rosea]MBB6053285.1 spore maturation protein SpmA [Armatimonas rosea]